MEENTLQIDISKNIIKNYMNIDLYNGKNTWY